MDLVYIYDALDPILILPDLRSHTIVYLNIFLTLDVYMHTLAYMYRPILRRERISLLGAQYAALIFYLLSKADLTIRECYIHDCHLRDSQKEL